MNRFSRTPSSAFSVFAFLCLIGGYMACQPAAEQPRDPAPEEEAVEAPTPSVPDKGFVLGDNVNVRVSPHLKAARLDQVNMGQVVPILSVSEGRIALNDSDNPCDAYPWVQIKLPTGRMGWLYGQFLYQLLPTGSYVEKDLKTRYPLDGQTHELVFGKHFGPGASDENGLTGCEDYALLGLLPAGGDRVHLLATDQSELGYLTLRSDDGANEWIKAIEVRERAWVLTVSASYQEGTGEYEVEISDQGTEFQAEYVEE